MANAMMGQADVRLGDGRTLRLVVDFNAVAEATAAYGADADTLFRHTQDPARQMLAMRALVFGGLREHHPELSLPDVGRLFTSDGQAIYDAMDRVQRDALGGSDAKDGEAGAGKAGARPPAPRGTGTNSSPPGSKPGSSRTASGDRRRAASPPPSAAPTGG